MTVATHGAAIFALACMLCRFVNGRAALTKTMLIYNIYAELRKTAVNPEGFTASPGMRCASRLPLVWGFTFGGKGITMLKGTAVFS